MYKISLKYLELLFFHKQLEQQYQLDYRLIHEKLHKTKSLKLSAFN